MENGAVLCLVASELYAAKVDVVPTSTGAVDGPFDILHEREGGGRRRRRRRENLDTIPVGEKSVKSRRKKPGY